MSEDWWSDDDQLMELLREALSERAAVPEHVVESGKALYTWRSIDAELAALTFDSQTAPAAGARAERATIRELTFATGEVSIHLQAAGTDLHGQVVPPQRGELIVQVRGRSDRTVPIDELGWFTISPAPGPQFRLLGRLESGRAVLTSWLQL